MTTGRHSPPTSIEPSHSFQGNFQREFITKNELNGHCERLGLKLSQRQRVVITRSTESSGRRRIVIVDKNGNSKIESGLST